MLISFFKEDYLDAYLKYFNQSKRQFTFLRFFIGFFLFALSLIVVFMIGKPILFLMSPILFFIGYKFPYLNLLFAKKKKDLTVSFLFPQFLQSFMALLPTSGNVYQTLRLTVEYTDDPIQSKLIELIEKIEINNDRQHYLDFANFVGTSEAYMIMDMIYQFSEYGINKESLVELRNFTKNIRENKIEEYIQQEMSSMDKYGYMPIFIAMFFVLGYASAIFLYYSGDIIKALNVFN